MELASDTEHWSQWMRICPCGGKCQRQRVDEASASKIDGSIVIADTFPNTLGVRIEGATSEVLSVEQVRTSQEGVAAKKVGWPSKASLENLVEVPTMLSDVRTKSAPAGRNCRSCREGKSVAEILLCGQALLQIVKARTIAPSVKV